MPEQTPDRHWIRSVMLGLAAVCCAGTALGADECTVFVRAGFVPAGMADGRTPESAFPTLTEGVQALRNPGDVLCVGPGLYVEGNLDLRADGAPGLPEGGNPHPIQIRGDSSGKTTGDAPGPVRLVAPTEGPGAETITTGFLLMARRHVIIEGFEISGFRDAGIQVRAAAVGSTQSSDVTIRNTVIRDCGTGIDVLAEGLVVIENNRLIGNRTTGLSVERCLTAMPFGRCRSVAREPLVPVISNNRVGGNDAGGIFLRATDNGVVQNNVIYANGLGSVGAGINLRGCSNTLVANNLVYANREQGLSVGKQDLASPGTIVLNNTFYANGSWGIEIGSAGAGSPRGAVVNNIVWQNAGGAKGIGVLNENSGLMPIRPASTCGYVAGFNLVLDQYGPDTPFNLYDRSQDPRFVNPAGVDGVLGGERIQGVFLDSSADDDFRLQNGSPAIDAGSTDATALQLTGSATADGAPDTGRVDIGFHYDAVPEQVLGYSEPFMPVYVRRTGNDTADGRTPTTALATVGAASALARAGVTVVVGPGRYPECQIRVRPNAGKAAFLADPAGELTGDLARAVHLDASQCRFNPETLLYDPGETGLDVSAVCDLVVDGFHISGAFEDGIRVDAHSDRAVVRNNVVFANGQRGIRVVNSENVHIVNNLAYYNGTGGIALGGSCAVSSDCPTAGSPRALIEFNTVIGSPFNGILVGDGIGVSSHGTVRYNVTIGNGSAGVAVGSNSTRQINLVGFSNGYNLIADRYAAGVPVGVGDIVGLGDEPLYVDPTMIDASGDWLSDTHFRLVQSGPRWSRAVDWADVTAEMAAIRDRSTRIDGGADVGPADLGYHYPRRAHLPGDCDGDGRVVVNELVMGVNIAVGQAPMSACEAVDMNRDGRAAVNELVRAVTSALQG